jgi:hypothetical protein
MVVDLRLQARLQVGAMHHPIGRAGAKAGGLAERQAGDLAAAPRAHDVDGLGRHRARRKPRLQAEVDQDPAGVGRKLQAGAGFLQPFGLLQNDDAKAFGGERKRCRQSPDPGTSNDDGARGSHRRSGDLVLQDAFRRAGLARGEVGGKAVQRRAIGADDLVVVAEVEKHVRMVERRLAPTHMNSCEPISITETPASLWKCGTT